MTTTTILEICLTESYPEALEHSGVSYSMYIAIRRDRRFPALTTLSRRNMEVRVAVLREVSQNPRGDYRSAAHALGLPVTRAWKIFADYMLHDPAVRQMVSRCNIVPV